MCGHLIFHRRRFPHFCDAKSKMTRRPPIGIGGVEVQLDRPTYLLRTDLVKPNRWIMDYQLYGRASSDHTINVKILHFSRTAELPHTGSKECASLRRPQGQTDNVSTLDSPNVVGCGYYACSRYTIVISNNEFQVRWNEQQLGKPVGSLGYHHRPHLHGLCCVQIRSGSRWVWFRSQTLIILQLHLSFLGAVTLYLTDGHRP